MPYREGRADGYPALIGLIFVFNLIVGTGALTLPAVFVKAGWLLSVIITAVLAVISFITATFVIETMSCANAVIQWQRLQYLNRNSSGSSSVSTKQEDNEATDSQENLLPPDSSGLEQMPLSFRLSQYYALSRKVEMGEMAGLFFNDIGRVMFYFCIVIYMYGDLSIYSAAVAKSLRDLVCSTNNTELVGFNDTGAAHCWESHTLSRLDVYRLFLVVFIITLGPFAFFSVQKTKKIQIFTLIFRCLAFALMIGLAARSLFLDGRQGNPPAASIIGLPSLFGTCIYSFMCHHSLPSLIVPINDKTHLKSLLGYDYFLIFTIYVVLALTGAFAFAQVQDLYTLNFIPIAGNALTMKIIEYFLSLFPVFTLSASFPIVAITLRNNLQTLFLDMSRFDSYNLFLRRILFPMLAIVPPFAVTYFTESLSGLVGFTGSYAGTGIQYLIPVSLVYFARQTCADLLGRGLVNEYRSPFSSSGWLVFVVMWSGTCALFSTVYLFS